VRLKRRSWLVEVALFAAYMLVLQSVFGAMAAGSSFAAGAIDPFGNSTCLGNPALPDQTPASHDHSSLPDCCTFACSMFAPLTAADRDPPVLGNARVAEVISVFLQDQSRVVSAPERDSGRPRAPPPGL
jgi:hypothetical protein